jgi:hypothetical protein
MGREVQRSRMLLQTCIHHFWLLRFVGLSSCHLNEEMEEAVSRSQKGGLEHKVQLVKQTNAKKQRIISRISEVCEFGSSPTQLSAELHVFEDPFVKWE